MREIGDEHEARNFLPAVRAREVFDVGEGLRLREAEVFAEALVLDEQLPPPEQIDRALVALQVDDIRLEGRERRAAQAEDIEEVIPERLLLRALGTVARVLPRKADGAVADFVPAKVRHGGRARASGVSGRAALGVEEFQRRKERRVEVHAGFLLGCDLLEARVHEAHELEAGEGFTGEGAQRVFFVGTGVV